MEDKNPTEKERVFDQLAAIFFLLGIVSPFAGLFACFISQQEFFFFPLALIVSCVALGALPLFALLSRKAAQDADPYKLAWSNKEYEAERKKQAEQKRQAELIGAEKYIDAYERQVKFAKLMVEGWEIASKNNLQNTHAQAQTSSWAIRGGIADGIAGPAAGVAVALDVQRQNAEAEARAAATREEAVNQISYYSKNTSEARREQRRIESIDNEIRSFLKGCKTDASDLSGKFASVVTETGSIEFEHEALHVNVEAAISSSKATEGSDIFEFDGATGILDGSFRVIAKEDGRPIGEGFYNPPVPPFSPGTFTGFNWNTPGLPRETNIKDSSSKVVVIPFAHEKFSPWHHYTIEVQPYHLWYIDLGTYSKMES